MATIPAAGYISNAARTQSEVQTAWNDIVASLRQVPGAGQTELSNTIASGSITPAGSGGFVVVDTEAAAATDDLTNIVTTNYPDGSCLYLRNANAARVVTLKQLAGGAGQMNLDRSVDYVLDDTKKWILLQRRSADWYEVFRGPQRMTSLTVSKTASFTVAREDLGKVFLCNGSAAMTVTLTAAASLGNGFVVGIRNLSQQSVTIDPNSSELIDGGSTLNVPTGWGYLLVCDGTAWRTVASNGPVATANPIINGIMEVWQRGTSFVNAANGATAADRWQWFFVGAGVATLNRSTSVPTVTQAGVLFNYALEVDVTTVDSSIAAGDYYVVTHKIEGGTWRHFAQRDLVMSFWVYSSKTGTHCVTLRNSGNDRSYVATYTVNSANTWEYKSVTILASPSAGTWDYGTGIGAMVIFGLAVGSTYQTTAGAWQTGNFYATSAQVNLMDNAANVFRLTGVKLEVGSVATPLDVTSFDVEYQRCLRYYQKSFADATAPVQNAGSGTNEHAFTSPVGASTAFSSITVPLQGPMRAVPTVTLYNPNAANAQVRNQSLSTDCTGSAATNVGEKTFAIVATTPASTTTTHKLAVHWAANAEL